MWFFDGEAWPGWHDYVGLLLTVVGFVIAFAQLRKTRKATEAATTALGAAQRQLSQRAIMSVVPQIQTVAADLGYALPANDTEVATRTLVRFSLMARETSGVLVGLDGDNSGLSARLIKAADKATKAKAALVSTPSADVIVITKSVANDIDRLSQDLMELASTMRNTIEGADLV